MLHLIWLISVPIIGVFAFTGFGLYWFSDFRKELFDRWSNDEYCDGELKFFSTAGLTLLACGCTAAGIYCLPAVLGVGLGYWLSHKPKNDFTSTVTNLTKG